MKEEDRVVLLFLGWGIMMFVVVAMYCSITYKLEQISRRVDQMGEKLRIEMKHPKQATETDATETDATPAEPEKVSMEIREEFREPKKIATPSDAIKAEKLREEVREKEKQEAAKQPVGTYELTAYIATGSPLRRWSDAISRIHSRIKRSEALAQDNRNRRLREILRSRHGRNGIKRSRRFRRVIRRSDPVREKNRQSLHSRIGGANGSRNQIHREN